VPRIGLGTAHIGKGGTHEAIAIVQKAMELGINFIDTAPLYQTEDYVGMALEGVARDSYVLATKVGQLPGPDNTRINIYSRDAILSHVEASLKRLKMDRIDILHIHDADMHYEAALNEAYPTLAELRSQGVIKAVGAGMNQWEMLLDFAKNADFDCFLLAGRYTLLEQTSLDALNYFRDHQVGIFAGGVYNSGILATGATSNALIVVKQDKISQELALRGIEFSSGKAYPRAVDSMAYGAGVESGRAAGIGGQGVNGGRQILLK
jgi:D-threo-aldose 1-dehydrogenase